MYMKYAEVMLIKDLFTSKFDPNKLFNAITQTESGDLLCAFDIKQIDKLSPAQITYLLGKFKYSVLRAYRKRTSHKILERILDYSYDDTIKYDDKITVGMKDLPWFLGIIEHKVCNIYTLWKDRFQLSEVAKKEMLEKYPIDIVKCFRGEFTEKQLAKYADKNVRLIEIMKKPTAEQLWKYYKTVSSWAMCNRVEVDCYPNDLLVQMIHDRHISVEIIRRNDRTGLIKPLFELVMNNARQLAETIQESKNAELQNYGALVNYDCDLLKQYIYNQLGVENVA